MKIYRVTDKEFKEYGAVVDVDASEIIAVAEKVELPGEGSAYEPVRGDFEATDFAKGYFKNFANWGIEWLEYSI